MIEKEYGSANGTHNAYAIEVRQSVGEPFELNQFVVTGEWRRYPARIVPCEHKLGFHGGLVNRIPVNNLLCPIADNLHLMDFNAAYALVCVLQKQAEGLFKFLHTRLVKVEIQYSWEAKAIEVSAEISLHEVRKWTKFESFSESA